MIGSNHGLPPRAHAASSQVTPTGADGVAVDDKRGIAADDAPWHALPDDVRDIVLGMLPPAVLATVPAPPAVHARALVGLLGRSDAADGIANPRRALLATCRLIAAPQLEVTPMQMPAPPPGWVDPRLDEAAIRDKTVLDPWGTVGLGMATWGTKLAYPVENNPNKVEPGQELCHHAGVAILDVVSKEWTQLYDLGCSALALGPEGVFTFGRGRLALTGYDGREVWNVNAFWQLEHIALGASEVLGVYEDGQSLRFDRATGEYLSQGPGPATDEFVIVHEVESAPGGFLGTSKNGRALTWSDDGASSPPAFTVMAPSPVRQLRANLLGLAACHLVPSRLASSEVNWRPGRGLPGAVATSWPEKHLCGHSLQLVGENLFWRSEPWGGEVSTLMRAGANSAGAVAVAALPSTVRSSAVVHGAYYTFDGRDYRTLLRVAPRDI